jgi:hypothetical protein
LPDGIIDTAIHEQIPSQVLAIHGAELLDIKRELHLVQGFWPLAHKLVIMTQEVLREGIARIEFDGSLEALFG